MSARQDRVATAIRKEVARIVLQDMRDPRLATVTITSVEVTADWSMATVHVSALGGDAELKAAVESLNNAAGFVRRELAPTMTMRHCPALRFVPDDSARKAQRLEELFREDRAELGEPRESPES